MKSSSLGISTKCGIGGKLMRRVVVEREEETVGLQQVAELAAGIQVRARRRCVFAPGWNTYVGMLSS